MVILYRPPGWRTREEALERLESFRMRFILEKIVMRDLFVHIAALLLVFESCTMAKRSYLQWAERQLFLQLRWQAPKTLVFLFLMVQWTFRVLSPLVLLVPKFHETSGTLAPSLSVATTVLVDGCFFGANTLYVFAWLSTLALLAFLKIDKAVFRRSLQVPGGGWLTATDARLRSLATNCRLRICGPSCAFVQVLRLVLGVFFQSSSAFAEATVEDRRSSVGILALSLLLTTLDRKDVNIEEFLQRWKAMKERIVQARVSKKHI